MILTSEQTAAIDELVIIAIDNDTDIITDEEHETLIQLNASFLMNLDSWGELEINDEEWRIVRKLSETLSYHLNDTYTKALELLLEQWEEEEAELKMNEEWKKHE